MIIIELLQRLQKPLSIIRSDDAAAIWNLTDFVDGMCERRVNNSTWNGKAKE